MLVDRLRTSALLILVTAGLLTLDAQFSATKREGLYLLPLLLFFTLGTAWDLTGMLLNSGRTLSRKIVVIGAGLISVAPAVPLVWNACAAFSPKLIAAYPSNCPIGQLSWPVVAAICVMFAILLAEMKDYGKEKVIADAGGDSSSSVIESLARGMFAALYVGLPMSLLVSLRSLGDGNWGLAALLTMIATTKSADAGAYFVGKAVGRNKLIPRLSPGKTWEGAIGGVVVATLVAIACLHWLFPWVAGAVAKPVPLYFAIVLGPTLAVAGMVGDLAESLVKRDCGAKDSGNLLPGLGGVWDVTDSLIAAVLPAFLCFAAAV